MLYANIKGAIDAFAFGDKRIVGNIIQELYPARPGAKIQTVRIGSTTLTWDPSQVYNGNFVKNMTDHQVSVLVMDIFGKIFESYNLRLPTEFQNRLDQMANGDVPDDDRTLSDLFLMLIARFHVSAIYYLVACVFLCSIRIDRRGHS